MSIELLRPSPHFKKYTSFVAPIPLNTDDSRKTGEPCTRLRATGAGTITVKRASDAASIVLDVLAGEYVSVACTEITSVTGVTAVTVFW